MIIICFGEIFLILGVVLFCSGVMTELEGKMKNKSGKIISVQTFKFDNMYIDGKKVETIDLLVAETKGE